MSDTPEPRPDPPVIRPATNADVMAIAQVHIASWRETYPGLLPDRMLSSLSVAERAIQWQRVLSRPEAFGHGRVFVADRGGEVVGLGSCNDQRDPILRDRGFGGEVSALYVLRSAQGQGAGSKLMAAMAAALADRDHRALGLWVLEANARACAFYENRGGAKIARKPESIPEIAYGWSDLSPLIKGGRVD